MRYNQNHKERGTHTVQNTNEAIIDQCTFDKVQQINRERRQQFKSRGNPFPGLENTENIMKGLLYCGKCGAKLMRRRMAWENKEKSPGFHAKYGYFCPTHTTIPSKCDFLSIHEDTVLNVAWGAIQVQVQLAEKLEKEVYSSPRCIRTKKELGEMERQLDKAREELQRIQKHRMSLYDDYADHLMDGQDYIYAQGRYKEKESLLRKHIFELEHSCQTLHKQEPENNVWLTNVLPFRGCTGLTRKMALALVEKITVYHTTKLHIDFRFRDDYEV